MTTAAPRETLVSQRTDDGYAVYTPAEPKNYHLVRGTQMYPDCTCPDFQQNSVIDPRYVCQHIETVIQFLPRDAASIADPPKEALPYGQRPSAESRHVPMQAPPPDPPTETGGATMLLKRSISPDGRIDSLSIEFSRPVPDTSGEIKVKAFRMLELQDEIATAFRRAHVKPVAPPSPPAPNGAHGNGNGNGYAPQNSNGYPPQNGGIAPDGSMPATLVGIAGMQTRTGWSMFINVAVNGRMVKLFDQNGNLGQRLSDAGYPHLAGNIQTGVQLNLPCRVTLVQKGRYTNVERVMPSAQTAPVGGGSSHGDHPPF